MKSFLKEHLAFSVYLWILLFLNVGVITYTGIRHLDKMLIVTASFVAFYFGIIKLTGNKSFKFKSIAPEKIKYLELGLICFSLLIFVTDLIVLKGLPGLHLFSTTTVEQATSLRQDIHLNSPKILVYLSGFNIRGFFPFLIMYFLIRRQSIAFTVFAILGAFYAFGFLQKSLIIFMFLPSIVVAIHQRKYLHFFLMSSLVVGSIFTIIKGSSNKVYENEVVQEEPVEIEEGDTPFIFRAIYGIGKRILFVPGEMVGLWFDIVPSEKPYLYGDGYPILPTLKGHEYVDYNKELYPLIRPEYAERGLHGSVNVATFVREYANFGYFGLVLSSLFLSFFLYFLEKLFKDSLVMLISMNLIYLLLLSSSNLFTILLSGGWIVLISLYFIFKPSLLKSIQSS